MMKADANGTPCQQSRARMGWKGSAERKAAGGNPEMMCSNCHFSERPYLSTTGRGSYALVGIRCVHLEAWGGSGMATRDAACCDRWEAKRP
jgi:hypothetical protein